MAAHIAGVPGFSDCRSMLDLGGGPAVNAMAVVQAGDRLRAVVFDRPDIARMARRYIATYGFEDRVTTIGGNYLTDSLGDGYDLIMITDTLYYSDSEIDPVLEKCRCALNPGGMLVGIHAVLTHDRTRPASLVLGLLTETMTGQARMPESGFLAGALRRCGFEDISSEMVTVCGSPMEMNVAGKR
jgi:predicted O-methyltransferase YrrM